jgi:hypothetical protein
VTVPVSCVFIVISSGGFPPSVVLYNQQDATRLSHLKVRIQNVLRAQIIIELRVLSATSGSSGRYSFFYDHF